MSTQYTIYEKELNETNIKLEIDERSSRFDLVMTERRPKHRYQIDTGSVGRMSAEELVDMAVKMIQPTLYNVEDPGAFFDNVIMKKIKELYVDRS